MLITSPLSDEYVLWFKPLELIFFFGGYSENLDGVDLCCFSLSLSSELEDDILEMLTDIFAADEFPKARSFD